MDLISDECFGEGTKLIELDRTELFTQVMLRSRIVLRSDVSEKDTTLKGRQRAMGSAMKYGLAANSMKSKLVLEPDIEIVRKNHE